MRREGIPLHILFFTDEGKRLAERIAGEGEDVFQEISYTDGRKESLAGWTKKHFRTGQILLYVGACGIAVRAIAPYVQSKQTDPAVLVADERGRFVISLLSGHLGEANSYAEIVAGLTGGQAVITTATDVNGLFAVDVFAKKNGLVLTDFKAAKEFTANLLKTKKGILVIPEPYRKWITVSGEVPEELTISGEESEAGTNRTEVQEAHLNPGKESCLPQLLLSPQAAVHGTDSPLESEGTAPLLPPARLQLIPPCLILGVGLKKGKTEQELLALIRKVLQANGLLEKAIGRFASIDLKKDEPALWMAAETYGVPLRFFTAEELMQVKGEFSKSAFVQAVTGADNVCERAVIAAGAEEILVPKTAENGVTLAIGIRKMMIRF
ncbi:MAG: cobalamin biosynthesis protein [Lachnospiraceae bacterium]|nr:cobalamin biosynthesis protein [Lachnospiraceae bacterium]